MMNRYILLTRDKSFDITLFKEFLDTIIKKYQLNERESYILVTLESEEIDEIKEAINSYIFEEALNIRAFFGEYEGEDTLSDELDVITKYFNNSLINVIYDKKSLLNEIIKEDLSDYKALILKDYANDYDMQNTLKVFFNNNMNVLKSSKELYVHRNTLINKLERFKEKTGYDPKNFNDAYLIYSLIK